MSGKERSVADARKELRDLSARIDALFDLGKTDEGRTLLEEALAGSGDDDAYRLFFQGEAAGYLERDRKKQRELLLRAYRLGMDDPFIVRNVGICFLFSDRERKAIRFFDRAIALDPSDAECYRDKGLAFSNLGRERRAMTWFARALEINPLDYDAMRQTGVSLSKLGKDREAIGWYRRALGVNENDYDAMRQLAVSLAMIGRYEAAVEWFNLALAVNPHDFESRRNLALVMKKMSGEGETPLSKLLNYLGRKISTAWKLLVSQW